MQLNFKHGLVFLVSMLASSQSVAAAPAASSLEARAPTNGNLYLCTDWDWNGYCYNYNFIGGACYSFTDTPLDKAVSSVGPDGGWTCDLFVDLGCSSWDGEAAYTYPGVAELGYFNDQFSSFRCNWSG